MRGSSRAAADASFEGVDGERAPIENDSRRQEGSARAGPPPNEGRPRRSGPRRAELVAATELLPPDRISAVRGRAGAGTLAQAIVDEGYAQSDGIARALARRHGMPYLDLGETRASPDAVEPDPLRTLQRVVAVPIALVGDRLRVAVADPANIHGIDELRVAAAMPWTSPLRAARTFNEIARVARQTEVLETQTAIDELQVEDDEEALEVDDGVSDAPLVRLVNSIIMQAAGDGTSTSISRTGGVLGADARRRPHGDAADPETDGVRAADATNVLAKLDIAERRSPRTAASR